MKASIFLLCLLVVSGAAESLVSAADAEPRRLHLRPRTRRPQKSHDQALEKTAEVTDAPKTATIEKTAKVTEALTTEPIQDALAAADVPTTDPKKNALTVTDVPTTDAKEEATAAADVQTKADRSSVGGAESGANEHQAPLAVRPSRRRQASSARRPPHAVRASSAVKPSQRRGTASSGRKTAIVQAPPAAKPSRRRGTATYRTSSVRGQARPAARSSLRRGTAAGGQTSQVVRAQVAAKSQQQRGTAATEGRTPKVARVPAAARSSRRRATAAAGQTSQVTRAPAAAKSQQRTTSAEEKTPKVVRVPVAATPSRRRGTAADEQTPKAVEVPVVANLSRTRGTTADAQASKVAPVPVAVKPSRRQGAAAGSRTSKVVRVSTAAKPSRRRGAAPAEGQTRKVVRVPAAPKPSRRRGTAADGQKPKLVRVRTAAPKRSREPSKDPAAASQAPRPSQQEGIAAAAARTAHRIEPEPKNKARRVRPTSGANTANSHSRRRSRKKGRTSSAQVAISRQTEGTPASAAVPARPPVPSLPVGKDGRKIVCYYTNWSQYRPAMGKYMPKDIDPFLCTHVVFAFSSMSRNRLSPFEQNDLLSQDGQPGLYAQVTGLKKLNPKLKVLLAVGGWSFGTKKFKDMSSNRYNRRTFVYSVAPYLRAKNFDGLDLDWEYPKGATDKANFVELCRELREAFEEESLDTGEARLLLTAAVPVGPDTVRGGYDVAKLARYLDLFHIMAYDFHGKWERQAGHNAPLNAPLSDSAYRRGLSVNASVHMWISMGAPKHKIVLGMPTYGRSFTLASPYNAKVNAPARGGGVPGQYTNEEGFLAYYEICQKLHSGAAYVWDNEMSVPYMVDGDQWVGFDDERAIRIKMDFIREMDLAGAMVWSVDMDDFAAAGCGGAVYPLMTAMREELLEIPRVDNAPDIDWSRVAKRQLPVQPQPQPQPQDQTASSALSQISIADILAILKAQGITPDLSAIQKLQAKVSRGRTTAGVPSTSPAAVDQTVDDNLAPPKIFCYVTSWARDRPGRGRFSPSDLDPDVCTHVLWAFGGVTQGRLQLPSEDQDRRKADSDYQQMLRLREANTNLRILLSIGGHAVEPETFRQLTSSDYRMNNFVYDAVDTIRRLKLDGLDIDWEYPSGPEDRDAYSRLIREFRLAFDSEAAANRKARLLLTVAVPGSPADIQDGYNIPEISQHVDFLNVMMYDFHGAWEDVVGHNAPLYPLQSASPEQQRLSLDGAAKELLQAGAPPEKTLVGLPTYGRTFTLSDAEQYDIGAPVADAGKQARFSQEPGFAAYYEVCDFLDRENTTLVWDHEQEVPFAINGDQWLGFDDETSLEKKVAWLRELGFGGVQVWTADLDDFGGTCGTGPYPLLLAVRRALDGYRVPYTYDGVIAAPGTRTRTGTRTAPALGQTAANGLVCSNDDNAVTFHRDPLDCKHYYLCQGSVRHHMPCPSDLVFNEAESVCDWPENVEECWAFTAAPPAI